MKSKLCLTVASLITALCLTGCSNNSQSASADENTAEPNIPKPTGLPLYTGYWNDFDSLSKVKQKYGDELRYWGGAYTLADDKIDALIAGERRGDEQSFYVTALPAPMSELAGQALQDGEYPPVIVDRFYTPDDMDPLEYEDKVYNHPRAAELDRKFSAVHKLDMVYVMNECELIADAKNDTLP